MKQFFLVVVLVISCTIVHSQEIRQVRITDVEKLIAGSSQPLVINFWATFCKPCMAEIPHFRQAAGRYKKDSLRVIFISLDMADDYPAKIMAFTKKQQISSWWLNETNADYFCPRIDPGWSGAIPATVFVNNRTGYRKFTERSLDGEELAKEISALLK